MPSTAAPQATSRPATPARDDAHEAVDPFAAPPDMRSVPDDAPPSRGFRGFLYSVTGGHLNLGLSQAEMRDRERVARIQHPLDRPLRIAFLCFKGGVGKTSTAAGVMTALSRHRADGVVVVDLNPDTGDLAERITGEQQSAIYDFAQDCEDIERRGELTGWVVTHERLACLPGEADPSPERVLQPEDVARVVGTLERRYDVIGLDAGTGFAQPVMQGILQQADVAVVCASYSLTGARRAVDTLEWLRRHGYARLADDAVIALTDKDRTSARVSKDRVMRWLSSRTRGLVMVPNDPHVADGRQLSFEMLLPATQQAYEQIAALAVDQGPAG